MKTISYTFSATRFDFDGARVLADAEKEGGQILAISLGAEGKREIWMKDSLTRRIFAVGGKIAHRGGLSAPDLTPTWGIRQAYMEGGWVHIQYVRYEEGGEEVSDPAEIWCRLLEAEKEEAGFCVTVVAP